MNSNLHTLEKRMGYTFRNIRLLEQALTHSSYAYEHHCASNERLEFLGDSILNFAVTEKIFGHENLSEGEMSRIRADSVSRQPLADAVYGLGALECLRLGVGASKEENLSVKFISDIFEALIGAIYLDSGALEECKKFIFSHIGIASKSVDYKSELQELIQAKKMGEIKYLTVPCGSATKPEFRSEVSVGGKIMGKGFGGAKKEAEKAAAQKAIEILTCR